MHCRSLSACGTLWRDCQFLWLPSIAVVSRRDLQGCNERKSTAAVADVEGGLGLGLGFGLGLLSSVEVAGRFNIGSSLEALRFITAHAISPEEPPWRAETRRMCTSLRAVARRYSRVLLRPKGK